MLMICQRDDAEWSGRRGSADWPYQTAAETVTTVATTGARLLRHWRGRKCPSARPKPSTTHKCALATIPPTISTPILYSWMLRFSRRRPPISPPLPPPSLSPPSAIARSPIPICHSPVICQRDLSLIRVDIKRQSNRI